MAGKYFQEEHVPNSTSPNILLLRFLKETFLCKKKMVFFSEKCFVSGC